MQTFVDDDIERTVRLGAIISLLVFGGFGLWAGVAPIEGAAHASGVVSVKSYKKVVQHLEGGIVSEIRARNGDRVLVGDPLLILDNTQPVAQQGIVRTQYLALKALESRLLAERDGLDTVIYPDELTGGSADATDEIATQNSIFESRRTTHEGSLEVLRQRINQLNVRKQGLEALRSSRIELAESYGEELETTRSLLSKGFTDKTRLREIERNYNSLTGDVAELAASISSADIEMGEARLQILQQQNEFQNEIVTQLGETRTRLRDVGERIKALDDVVERTIIRSPESGIVNNLAVHTIGAVIEPGTVVANIVPLSDDLIIEAKVSPLDIDRVQQGQQTTIRFSSFSMGTVPTVHGEVLSISADSIVDPASGLAYYQARVEVTPDSLGELGDQNLVPGMPAEVFISTGARTFLQYLFKPLSNAVARSFRED